MRGSKRKKEKTSRLFKINRELELVSYHSSSCILKNRKKNKKENKFEMIYRLTVFLHLLLLVGLNYSNREHTFFSIGNNEIIFDIFAT